MNEKVLLYSADAANADTRNFFTKKDYALVKLTQDTADFWKGVESVAPRGFLALLSHGDTEGPSMVSGSDGAAMTAEEIERLGQALVDGGITLYLLSCLTGNDPFLAQLTKTGCLFVAPQGYAELRASSAGTWFYSVKAPESTTYLPWSGSEQLVPNRLGKALNIA